MSGAEEARLAASAARGADWKNWGPYVSERAWGTVREDYSAEGEVWDSFPHAHARSRAYRWNEDGIAGVCNRFQNICLAVAFWNERDPFLKERLFGLDGREGNHGEDVKEYYFYLDNTPTHSYMKMLYKYPQVEFPYRRLVEENARRGREEPEYELVDALGGPLCEGRYFDLFIEYAKADEEDILCRITAVNRGPDPAPLHILPHVWFRNTWSWRHDAPRPELRAAGEGTIRVRHRHLGERWWWARAEGVDLPDLFFTENETNPQRVFGTSDRPPYAKDGIDDAVVHGRLDRVRPERFGTKAAARHRALIAPGGEARVEVRFSPRRHRDPFADFEPVFTLRRREADEFHERLSGPGLGEDERRVQRQALAGLLWTKQFYHWSVELWLDGDPAPPRPPAERRGGRNADWRHFHALDVLSMPDKWEYPWFASWDLAFHCVPLALVDPEWAKRQLVLLAREWYMHPSGQLPAYEWNLGDVNPPVHAWAAWRVYEIDRERSGRADTTFLARIFHKLLLNFTWWVNRKDPHGRNVFQGGFLGLDNIGLFDRSAPLPTGGHLEQADGTAWMGMYCANLLTMALELARFDPAYEDVATKFFEHFVYIASAANRADAVASRLWDEEEGFFYDSLHLPEGGHVPLRVRSFVGLVPLFAVETLDPETLELLPRFRRRMEWFLEYRPGLLRDLAPLTETGEGGRRLLSMVDREKLARICSAMLDPEEFLSEHGLRSLSRRHEREPVTFHAAGETYRVAYEPAESRSGLFGGNSNWRGPVWFPLNYLMIESLRTLHRYYGDRFRVPLPAPGGEGATLDEVASELSRCLISIFTRDPGRNRDGRRPVFGDVELFQRDPAWRDLIPFHEYFHGDTGAGLGASHQSGWTALVAELIDERARRRSPPRASRRSAGSRSA